MIRNAGMTVTVVIMIKLLPLLNATKSLVFVTVVCHHAMITTALLINVSLKVAMK